MNDAGGTIRVVDTNALSITFVEYGANDGWPVILSHGFPYDVHAFDDVASILVAAGARVVVPYCRGFGPTRFRSPTMMRSGQQAARGLDILELADVLELKTPILGGFDWGGNASCVAAALWPKRFGGLVSYAGYDIIDVAAQARATSPSLERVCWYQHLFQTERGRECLSDHRDGLCQILWSEWSPNWQFDEATFKQSAAAFENPDFVDVVIHCYRFHFGLEKGDSALDELEYRLALRPPIAIPTVTIDGSGDPLKPGGTADHAVMFVGRHEHRVLSAGHNVPQERPMAFAAAVLRVREMADPNLLAV